MSSDIPGVLQEIRLGTSYSVSLLEMDCSSLELTSVWVPKVIGFLEFIIRFLQQRPSHCRLTLSSRVCAQRHEPGLQSRLPDRGPVRRLELAEVEESNCGLS